MKRLSSVLSVLLGCMSVTLGAPAYADDSEVFTNSSFLATGVRPNILFVIDTSTSMNDKVNVFDPAKTYAGACPAGRIYWKTGTDKEPPACDSLQWISVANNRCRHAVETYSLDRRGRSYLSGGFALNGWWSGPTEMLLKTGAAPTNSPLNPTKWGNLTEGRDWKIECQADVNNHGDDPGTSATSSGNKYPRNGTGTSDTNRWGGSSSGSQINDWGTHNYSLYTSNYANWYATTDDGSTRTRFEIVRDVAVDMVNTLQGVNLGLMRYSTTNQGGMVTYPVSELTETARTTMTGQLEDPDVYSPNGFTPLSETYYEAFLYLSGGGVKYGDSSTAGGDDYKSVAGSRAGGLADAKNYDSPMDFSCQTTYIVYLTDGLPTEDVDAVNGIQGVTGKTCPASIEDPDTRYPDSGRCMATLAEYMSKTDLRPDVAGDQKVITYMIGFGDDIVKSKPFLKSVAVAGGTNEAYTQTDAAGLKATLQQIIQQVQDTENTTFVAPAVSVNAFNRSQTLNELYVSVFAPSKNLHWPGNLKKYRILNRDLYGVDSGAKAVDPTTGFFATSAQSLNSPGGADGPVTRVGGAAAQLEDSVASPRKLYTHLGTLNTVNDLTAADNLVVDGNTKISATMLGAGDEDERTQIIQYTRGLDLNDEDKASPYHHRMGDPMHARPAILIHGGTEAKPQGTVFVPTNDGVLHAFDMANIPEPADPTVDLTPKATTERWAFIPEEFLARQKLLFDDAPTAKRNYGLDGDVRVLKFDVNQNGIIDTGDKAYIFFGTGRGGSAYYALDVTDIDAPKFMWKIDDQTDGFGKLGKTWSAPQIGRVKIGTGSGQNAQKFVLLFGGGYDTDNDLSPFTFTYAEDDAGNALYMVDAVSGKLLWSASNSGTAYNFTDAKMTHSFPANLTALDTDEDLFLDRIYAADMDGKVWRFDITNGNSADKLVTGGVLASLGNATLSTKNYENARRFYSAPDVASMTQRGSLPYMNIAIGSGYRGHPLNKKTQDKFYSIRDYKPYYKRPQSDYTDASIIEDADLVDVTDMTKKVTDADAGWRLDLSEKGTWRGEKNLSESVTAAGVILFSTFTPLAADDTNPCLSRALNRVFAVNVNNGWAFTHWTDGATGPLKPEDRYTDTGNKGIAPSPQVLVDPAGGRSGICLNGTKVLNRCVDFGSAIRSYWEHK
jgi:type IV pilus assembly protein PilY1